MFVESKRLVDENQQGVFFLAMNLFSSFKPRFIPYELAQIQKEIQAVYDEASRAHARLDVEAMMRYTIPDFEVRANGVFFDREQFRFLLTEVWEVV